MKNFLLIIFCLSLFSCKEEQSYPASQYDTPNIYVSMNDELNNRVFIADSTLNARDIEFAAYRDSVSKIQRNSMTNCDSLKTAIFLANYKIEKVRFYLNICLKKPSQDKFLKGWIRRAIN